MFIITGATGKLGRMIVENLLERVPADQIGVSVRDTDKAEDIAARGVRVRRGDFADVKSLHSAFEGATQLLIISSNARATGGDPLAQHRNAIEAASSVGARRIVYTSHMAANATSAFPPMHDHAATEAMLQQSGIACTALRHGFYAESGIGLMGNALDTGVIEAPADGKVAWSAHVDLAAAAAIILTDEGKYAGPTQPLTGSEALDLADFAAIATEVTGRSITRSIVSDDTQRERMIARGLPDAAVEIALGQFAASRAGEFAPADPFLEQILGRPPLTIRDMLEKRR